LTSKTDDKDDENNNNNSQKYYSSSSSSENTDPVVNESFITPDFGYRRQYQGAFIYIHSSSRRVEKAEFLFFASTNTETSSFISSLSSRRVAQSVTIYSTRANRWRLR